MKIFTCKICGMEYRTNKFIGHLKKHFSDERELYRNFLYIYNDISIDDIIHEFKNGESVIQLEKKYGISLRKILKIFNCRRTISESHHTLPYKKRHINTIIQRFGVANVSTSDDIKLKKKNTFIDHFGYENNFCNNNIRNKATYNLVNRTSVQKAVSQRKYKNTLKEKYGPHIINSAQIPAVKEQISKCARQRIEKLTTEQKQNLTSKAREAASKCCKSQRSGLEANIERILNDNAVNFKINQFIGAYNCDFIFESNKIILEIYGDFFHANPLMYKEDDYIPKINKKAKQIWAHDTKKKNYICSLGYKYVILWENDIRRKSDDIIKQLLKKEGIIDEN